MGENALGKRRTRRLFVTSGMYNIGIGMSKTIEGKFKEIAHTADLALDVWGEDLWDLFRNAAQGLYALAGAVENKEETDRFDLRIPLGEEEQMLVDFLNELLYLLDKKWVVRRVEGKKTENGLRLSLDAARLAGRSREIKAATFHDLVLRKTEDGLRATIVFDV